MERIRQMTDTRRCALLWAATILLTAALLFLCGGKVHAWEGDDDWMRDTFSRYTMAAMLSGNELIALLKSKFKMIEVVRGGAVAIESISTSCR